MSKLITDRNLGSYEDKARKRAEEILAELRTDHPKVRLQFSQHAPEGYDNAYSAQFFVDEEEVA